MAETTTVTEKRVTTVTRLTSDDLRFAFKPGYFGPDDEVTFHFNVPTGGDWSGECLTITRVWPLVMTVVKTERSTT